MTTRQQDFAFGLILAGVLGVSLGVGLAFFLDEPWATLLSVPCSLTVGLLIAWRLPRD